MLTVTKPLRALALSLLPDPFYQSITVECGSHEARLLMLERYFEYSLLEAQRTGRLVFAPDASDGAAAWLLPRTDEIQTAESARKAIFMAQLLGQKGSANYHAIVDFMTPLAERHVSANAWYLSIAGVNPDAQGRGLGKVLLQPILDEASKHQAPCYLETFMPKNVRFYQQLGFVQVAEYSEPTTGAPYIIMCREGLSSNTGI